MLPLVRAAQHLRAALYYEKRLRLAKLCMPSQSRMLCPKLAATEVRAGEVIIGLGAPMHHTTLRYSEPLLRLAVRSFVFRAITRQFGTALFLAIAVLCGLTIYLLAQNDRSWLVGFLSATILFAAAFIVAVFLSHYRHTIGLFRQMRSPEATLAYDEQLFTLTSELGSTTMPWSAITEVWRYPRYWLLIFSPSQFVTLPIDCLDQDTKDFIGRKTRTKT